MPSNPRANFGLPKQMAEATAGGLKTAVTVVDTQVGKELASLRSKVLHLVAS